MRAIGAVSYQTSPSAKRRFMLPVIRPLHNKGLAERGSGLAVKGRSGGWQKRHGKSTDCIFDTETHMSIMRYVPRAHVISYM